MKALRWHGRGDLRYEDVAEPSAAPGMLKVKVHVTGICGSDVKEYTSGPVYIAIQPNPRSGRCAPLTLGHEFSGEVVEVGEGVSDFKVGDRVTADTLWRCGKCFYCLHNMPQLCLNKADTGFHADGSMAEYMIAPDFTFYKLPDSVSDELGALSEPLAVGLHAVKKSKLQLGDTVAIVGAGTIGVSTMLSVKAAGASRIFVLEISRGRGERALKMGATAVFNPKEIDAVEQVKKLTGGLGADVTFDCVGTPVSGPLAIELARGGGTVVIVGMSPGPSPDFNFVRIWMTEKHVVGSIGYVRDTAAVIDLLASGAIDPSGLITDRIPLEDAVEKGFKKLVNNPDKHLKILLQH